MPRHFEVGTNFRTFAKQSSRQQIDYHPAKYSTQQFTSVHRVEIRVFSLAKSSESSPPNDATAMIILEHIASSFRNEPSLSTSQSFPRLSSASRFHASSFIKRSTSVDPVDQSRTQLSGRLGCTCQFIVSRECGWNAQSQERRIKRFESKHS